MTSGPTLVLTVIGTDRAPTSSDAQLLTRAQAVIEADPHFKALSGASLQRGEVNAG